MKRSYYSNSITDFLADDNDRILGLLSLRHDHALEDLQKNAWVKQIEILKKTLLNFKNGQIYFEFAIPRMGKRVDNILIIDGLIFVLEFKIGENKYQRHSIEQVIDYCLDLQNFHEGSHHEKLVPVLICTKAAIEDYVIWEQENLFDTLKLNEQNFSEGLSKVVSQFNGKKIDINKWEQSIYKPTPTIIEAAQALYKNHSVEEISRHDAGAINLSITTDCINTIIEDSKAQQKKSICFLTGVPGAGKTLAGLNIANERMKSDEDEHAVFLSGNGPLVDVLREALTRDSVAFAKENGEISTKKHEKARAVKFIQNIHHFRDDNLNTDQAPVEKVVVFDEAQRAWTKEQASSFMRRKKGKDDFNISEPEFLIQVMDRHDDWCTVICLIGGGQEINTGEAGLSEWISSLKGNFSGWNIYYSNQIISDDNYLTNPELKNWLTNNGNSMRDLHLAVSMRSFRSEKISSFVANMLEGKSSEAKFILTEIGTSFPLLVTRDLGMAKEWVKKKTKGSERMGIIASSGARRLRKFGIDVKNEISAPLWFLNDSNDVRSSNYMEDIATEFDIQGLEIDWVCLAWDINLYFQEGKWNYQHFEGTVWNKIKNDLNKSYSKNTYRVLLTRARQGLVIFIPEGDDSDITRPKELYDGTFEYFKLCGIPVL
ncbi:MAG: hypothetical protein K0R51_293 [Cytophagaceae bacterium]|jgi:hypothetical protein|nr:hypothetical protein [Cytophagaceae bacterium]